MSQAEQAPGAGVVPEDMQIWRRRLIQQVLLVVALVGALVVAGVSYAALTSGAVWQIPIVWVAYGLLLVVTFWKRTSYSVQAGMLLALLYGMGVLNLFISGQAGNGIPFLLAVPVVAVLFFGRRLGTISLVMTTATLCAFGWAFVSGFLVIPPGQLSSVDDLGSWISRCLGFVMLALLLVLSVNYLFQHLFTVLGHSRKLAGALDAQRVGLEESMADRTAALERRNIQLQTAAQVARDASVAQRVEDLMDDVVHLVSERFGFYHTGILLLDEAGEYAVLRAASSEGGQRMLARGHRLQVGEVGIVGHVARWGEPRLALDVGQDAYYFDNPDLPQTRSEMALPLRARGQILGALDVQSTEPAAFDEQDMAVLQVLADQVAMAIGNAQLLQQMEESLAAERRAYGELSRQAWQELARTQPNLEQRYDPGGILPRDGRWREEMERAVQEARPVRGENGTSTTLALPLRVRDQIIGVLDAHKPASAGRWTDEEVAVLQTLVDQLGVALDSARMYQDTQRRAARERVTRDIADRMQRATDIEDLVRNALQDLVHELAASQAVVYLGTEKELGPKFEGKVEGQV